MSIRVLESIRCGVMVALGVCTLILLSPAISHAAESERRITVSEYKSKMTAGWIGQMAGVGWGFPTEFRFKGEIIPEDEVPQWNPEMVNAFDQDDLYVEMTFLRTLEEHGFDVSMRQAGIDFANSRYTLWVANREGRTNLRNRIAPPDSGHPQFNPAADAIDYQIEADFSGLIAPGMPNIAIKLGEKFGRIMNYGDGLYGGQFVGAMYAEAFFESDPARIVAKGLQAIPKGSQYAEAIRDVIRWHAENPDDWQSTWHLINEKYHLNPEYRQFTAEGFAGPDESFNIDAKLNGAYIVLGLLYGAGNIDDTIVIAMRAGQDSDCNPSSAAGILLTAQGYDNVPEKFLSAFDKETKFQFTEYTFPALVDVSEKLARQAVLRAGGRIEQNAAGEEEFVMPVVAPVPGTLEQSHNPGPIAGSVFTDAEWSKIEGSKLFRYALLALVLVALLTIKDNRSLRASAMVIPLAVIYALTGLLDSVTPDDLAATVDILTVLESLAVAVVLMLLLYPLMRSRGGPVLTGIAIGVLVAAGYVGVLGSQEGRVTSAFNSVITLYGIYAGIFFLATLFAALLSKRRYTKLRFGGLFVFGNFVIGLVAVYFILNMLMASKAPVPIGEESIPIAIVAISMVVTITNFILFLPFLLLSCVNKTCDERLQGWLRV